MSHSAQNSSGHCERPIATHSPSWLLGTRGIHGCSPRNQTSRFQEVGKLVGEFALANRSGRSSHVVLDAYELGRDLPGVLHVEQGIAHSGIPVLGPPCGPAVDEVNPLDSVV